MPPISSGLTKSTRQAVSGSAARTGRARQKAAKRQANLIGQASSGSTKLCPARAVDIAPSEAGLVAEPVARLREIIHGRAGVCRKLFFSFDGWGAVGIDAGENIEGVHFVRGVRGADVEGFEGEGRVSEYVVEGEVHALGDVFREDIRAKPGVGADVTFFTRDYSRNRWF